MGNKKIDKDIIQDIVALTPMQEGMFFHYLRDPGGEHYFEQLILKISGTVDTRIFEKAWNVVIETNEMLRVVYRWDKLEKPVQVILKHHNIQVRYHDLTVGENGPKNAELEDIIAEDRRERFDLREVPFRITLCKAGEAEYHMIVSNHHILYDGWSSGIILKEFFSVYNTLSRHPGPVESVKPEIIKKGKFKDFVKWAQTRGGTGEQETFWKEYLLSGANKDADKDTHKIDTPLTGKPKPAPRRIRRTGSFRFEIPRPLTRELSAFVKLHKITLASFLTGAWGLLLQKFNNTHDIIFDTTVSGRGAKIKGIEDMVGMFINTLPLRVRTESGETPAGLLTRLYAETQRREAFENTPLADINEYVEAFRQEMEPLFESVLILENYPLDRQLMQEKGTLSVDSFSISGRTQYDLTLIITIFDGIELDITFNKDLFDEELLSRLCRYFTQLMEAVTKESQKPVGEIEFIPGAELAELRERLISAPKPEPAPGVPYTAPRDDVEEKLAEIWSELLKVEKARIGIDADFFDFGGHSLKASLLAARMHRAFNVKIPLEEIFKQATIRRLAGYIRGASPEEYEAIEPAEVKDIYEVSSVQHRMYALQQLDPESTAYNVSSILEVEGELAPPVVDLFEKAFKELIRRHESLRTSFLQVDGEPKQKIHDNMDFELEYLDEGPSGTHTPYPLSLISSFIRPFDLSRLPLMRARLVKTGEARHLFILDMHHIITDGFSMNTFIRELVALCRGETLPPLKNQYKDFSLWQYDRLLSGKLKLQEDYWLNLFSGEVPVLDILTDFPRPAVQRFEGDRIHFVLDSDISARLDRLARDTGATLFMVLLTAFNVLLYRYTGQEDIVIGTTVSGREHPDLEAIVGLFIETLAIRNFPSGDKTFKEFLTAVRAQTLAAYENGSYPFRELIRKTVGSGEMAHNPLFNVMLIVQNVDMTKLELEGLRFNPYLYYNKMSKLDLTLEAVEDRDEIKFHIEYSTVLFKRDTVERLAGHFVNILKGAVADPGIPISAIDILSPEESRRIREDFRGSGWDPDPGSYPKDKRIEEIFEEQVARTPDHIAVVHEGRHITYRLLNERADLLSKKIKEL